MSVATNQKKSTIAGTQNKGTNLWRTILNAAAKKTELADCDILCLGKPEVQKIDLINELQKFGSSDVTKMELYKDFNTSTFLDYAHFDVRNAAEESGPVAKGNLWMLQDARNKEFIVERLGGANLKHMAILIFLSLDEAPMLKMQLKYWLDVTTEIMVELMKKISSEEQDAMRKSLAAYLSSYKAKESNDNNTLDFQTRTNSGEAIEMLAPADLVLNLGVPIVVVVCQAERVSSLNSRQTRGHDEVVQAHLRATCLTHGAALVYCGQRDRNLLTNTELLYRYLMHRIYGFNFADDCVADQGDAIFIPSGYDTSESVIAYAKRTVAEGLETPYESIITRQYNKQAEDEEELITETMNGFLMRNAATLGSTILRPAERKPTAPQKSADAEHSPHERQSPARNTSKQASVDASPKEKTSESLRFFFKSLLKKPEERGKAEDKVKRSGSSIDSDVQSSKTGLYSKPSQEDDTANDAPAELSKDAKSSSSVKESKRAETSSKVAGEVGKKPRNATSSVEAPYDVGSAGFSMKASSSAELLRSKESMSGTSLQSKESFPKDNGESEVSPPLSGNSVPKKTHPVQASPTVALAQQQTSSNALQKNGREASMEIRARTSREVSESPLEHIVTGESDQQARDLTPTELTEPAITSAPSHNRSLDESSPDNLSESLTRETEKLLTPRMPNASIGAANETSRSNSSVAQVMSHQTGSTSPRGQSRATTFLTSPKRKARDESASTATSAPTFSTTTQAKPRIKVPFKAPQQGFASSISRPESSASTFSANKTATRTVVKKPPRNSAS